jgi:hypothetical protein
MKRLRTKVLALFGLTRTQASSASKYGDTAKSHSKQAAYDNGGPFGESDGFDYSAYESAGPDAWKEALATAKRKAVIARVLGHIRNRTLASAFSTWARVALSLPSSPATSCSEDKSEGEVDEAAADPNVSGVATPKDRGTETSRKVEAACTQNVLEKLPIPNLDNIQGSTSQSVNDHTVTDSRPAANAAASTGVDPAGHSLQTLPKTGVFSDSDVRPPVVGEAPRIPAAPQPRKEPCPH